MQLSKEINEYYRKLAEVYIYGLSCTDCPFEKATCAGHENFCAERLKRTMTEIMKEKLEV